MCKDHKTQKNHKGATLPEIATTLAVIGIVAAIALPAYRAYVGNMQASADATGSKIGMAIAAAETAYNQSGSGLPSSGATSTSSSSTPSATGATAGAGTPADNLPTDGNNVASTPAATPGSSASSGSTASASGADANTGSTPADAGTSSAASGGSAGNSSTGSIAVDGKYGDCTSSASACSVKANSDLEVKFDVSALGSVSKSDIKVVVTGGADVKDWGYSGRRDTVTVDVEAPNKKNKTFTVTVMVDQTRSTVYFTTN
jgi:type IV pilus assembly protein PilA